MDSSAVQGVDVTWTERTSKKSSGDRPHYTSDGLAWKPSDLTTELMKAWRMDGGWFPEVGNLIQLE
jgi:hypothetical protein